MILSYVGFIVLLSLEYITTEKALLGYTNLCPPNDYWKDGCIIIQKYFEDKYGKKTPKRKLWLLTKKIHETRNFLLDETKYNELMNEKHKKTCRALNYFIHFFIFITAVSGCVSISAFASLVGVPVVLCSRIKNLCNQHSN